MTKIVQSKHKAERRYGIFWEGLKTPASERAYPPGQHGPDTRMMNRGTVYSQQMRAKQRLKKHYGPISEKQFRRLYSKAAQDKGNTGMLFLQLLERRLDACVYRLKFAPTIHNARQLVSHGHILVNGKRVNIPSYQLNVGDTVELREDMHSNLIVEQGRKSSRGIPEYLTLAENGVSGKLSYLPDPEHIPYPFDHMVHSIVELYAR